MRPAVFTSFSVRVLGSFAATGPLVLAYADDRYGLYFDLNSLIWVLIGALGWGVISYWLGHRSNAPSTLISKSTTVSVEPSDISEPAKRDQFVESDEKKGILSGYLTSLDETTTVTVEEVSNIEEQVDLFLLLGRHEVAISMLLARIGPEGDCDPRTWFKLLDIYHALGDRINFKKLANDICVRFNVALPDWEASTLQAEGRHGLERFPHLLARISDGWASPSSLGYLQSLIKDKRSGERSGFNEDAFREVMFLISILEQETDPQ